MKDKFEKLLKLRFAERNQKMLESFTREKQLANKHGLLNSSQTIIAMHKILKKELSENTDFIVLTAVDVIGVMEVLPKQGQLKSICFDALGERKDEIEGLFLNAVKHIGNGLLNKSIINPYMSISEYYVLQQEELNVKIYKAHQQYLNDHGGNLTSIIKNRFLNIGFVAWGIIVITTIIVIAAFGGALDGLKGLLV